MKLSELIIDTAKAEAHAILSKSGKKMEKFCNNQCKCKEDTADTWTCLAQMCEGRVRECPYDSYEDSQKGKYPCADVVTDRFVNDFQI